MTFDENKLPEDLAGLIPAELPGGLQKPLKEFAGLLADPEEEPEDALEREEGNEGFAENPAEPEAPEIPEEAAEPETAAEPEEAEFPEGAEQADEPEISEEGEAPEGTETPEDAEAPENAEGAETPEEAEAAESAGLHSIAPYHKRYYLLYGGEAEPEAMDTAGLKSFLGSIGFDGGELRQAREGKDLADAFRNAEQKDGSAPVSRCAYCGAEISGADYFKLRDGRRRCTNCTRSQVRTADELKAIYDRVVSNMETFFGAELKVPVNVEMLEERKLKKKLKMPLVSVDNNSMLILGVAVREKQKFSIYLENGAPRITVIATFAHELTHIWQYTHWNEEALLKKYGAKNRLPVYEGMAMWTEIQYLYLIGETGVAKRDQKETEARKDEYGIGFNIYENKYPIQRGAMSAGETPFMNIKEPL